MIHFQHSLASLTIFTLSPLSTILAQYLAASSSKHGGRRANPHVWKTLLIPNSFGGEGPRGKLISMLWPTWKSCNNLLLCVSGLPVLFWSCCAFTVDLSHFPGAACWGGGLRCKLAALWWPGMRTHRGVHQHCGFWGSVVSSYKVSKKPTIWQKSEILHLLFL